MCLLCREQHAHLLVGSLELVLSSVAPGPEHGHLLRLAGMQLGLLQLSLHGLGWSAKHSSNLLHPCNLLSHTLQTNARRLLSLVALSSPAGAPDRQTQRQKWRVARAQQPLCCSGSLSKLAPGTKTAGCSLPWPRSALICCSRHLHLVCLYRLSLRKQASSIKRQPGCKLGRLKQLARASHAAVAACYSANPSKWLPVAVPKQRPSEP